ncbi:hypothetical protein CC79DRAFT_1370701 [Sarocladium strictum]
MAELALGIIGLSGAVELCFKGAKSLIAAAQDYNQADAKLLELFTRVHLCWARSSSQLDACRMLESSMSQEQNTVQQQVVMILHSKLEVAVVALSRLDQYRQSGKQQKMRFLAMRDLFEQAVSDLEAWQKRSEPRWYELIKMAPQDFNSSLEGIAASKPKEPGDPARQALKFRRAFESPDSKRPIFASQKSLDSYDKKNIRHSTVHLGTDLKENKLHIIDTVSSESVTMKDARNFATKLRESNPQTFGTMRCKAIVKLPETASLAFVFRVPDGFDTVRSMRDLLLNVSAPESLSMRLEIARQLANAVYYIHLYEFVHKNICPETILNLNVQGQDLGRSITALVGFQVLRHVDGRTNTGKLASALRLYQHPWRQMINKTAFVMQHDIYSLGVCLLEIGLWESLLSFEGPTVTPSRTIELNEGHSDPDSVKAKMVALSRGRLRAQMGDKYSMAVETCLTCFDTDNTTFGDPDEFTDEDGVEVGSSYAAKVLGLINAVCL